MRMMRMTTTNITNHQQHQPPTTTKLKKKKKNHFSPTSPTYLDSVKQKFLAEFIAINPYQRSELSPVPSHLLGVRGGTAVFTGPLDEFGLHITFGACTDEGRGVNHQ